MYPTAELINTPREQKTTRAFGLRVSVPVGVINLNLSETQISRCFTASHISCEISDKEEEFIIICNHMPLSKKMQVFNGKHTQHECNGIVGESSCTREEENEGEDLPAWGEYLRCDGHSLKSHHEKESWPPPISV